MLKRISCSLSFVLMLMMFSANAQTNLVLNPGFEDYNKENLKTYDASGSSLLGYKFDSATVTDWYNPLSDFYESTPDFYINDAKYSADRNFTKPRTGKACAKIGVSIVRGDSSRKMFGYKEYIGGILKEKLKKGHRYKISVFTTNGAYDISSPDTVNFFNSWGLGFSDKKFIKIPA